VKRVYLDVCSIQRPLDDLTQPRVAAEAQAIREFFELCEQGKVLLVSSTAVELELERMADESRQEFTSGVLHLAAAVERNNPAVDRTWKYLCNKGIKSFDALHVAFAIETNVDIFCTCDDRLLRRLQTIQFDSLSVVSPLELLKEIKS